MKHLVLSCALGAVLLAGCYQGPTDKLPQSSQTAPAPGDLTIRDDAQLKDIERRTFNYFWQLTNPNNGLVPDRWPTPSFASIAAVGFGLGTYGVGIDQGWITREQGAERTLATLKFFVRAPQSSAATGAAGYKGFFYHFLDMNTGQRFDKTELSTVDTALLLGGVLFAQTYFNADNTTEKEIRELAEIIYRRVDWPWMQTKGELISMGWHPEDGVIEHYWEGYNEGMLVYLLALGSPTYPIKDTAWSAWTATYDKHYGEFHGKPHLNFAPLFGHQYTHLFVDFRGITDPYMKAKGFDYFENSRRAVHSQRNYAIANPKGCKDYGPNVWGLSASDGPLDKTLDYNGKKMLFKTYTARGVGLDYQFDDCTIVPTASLGSIAFAPEIVVPAAKEMLKRYGTDIYSEYGFLDAFNPSFRYDDKLHHGTVTKGAAGWVDGDYIGIDQGAIVLSMSNLRNELIWKTLRKNPHIVRGLQRAGFTGGWLDQVSTESAAK